MAENRAEKLVVLRSGRRFVDGVLLVRNYDQAFQKAFEEAEDEWNHCTEEYFDAVLCELRRAGYDVDLRDSVVHDSDF